MANNVFANGREISCKAGSGKSICAFPDVCFTPPQTPATPPGVPIPYPNTGMASDTTSGSKRIKISNKEVMLKNKSYFKTSTGDEAGCARRKGIITSKIKGKVYFESWSMDVKFEGENVVRHLDMTTHNHSSPLGNESVPWPQIDTQAFGNVKGCESEEKRAKKACKGQTIKNCSVCCKKYQACILVANSDGKKRCCKPNNTGHHLIEDHWVKGNESFADYRSDRGNLNFKPQSVDKSLDPDIKTVYDAPCVCVNKSRHEGKHGIMHDVQGVFEESYMPRGVRYNHRRKHGGWNYGAGKEAALWAHTEAFPNSKCSDTCLEAQLDHFYGKDNRRSLNKPSTQGLGADREDLKYVWGDVLKKDK